MAEWEREEISSRISSSIPIRAKLGKPLGGQAIFGYSWRNKEYVVNESEVHIRKLIYEIFIKTRRRKTTADELNKLGYRTRNGSLFSDTTINRLLRDTTAKGERISNYTTSSENGRIILKPKSEWTITKCPQIVSEQIWNKANSILDEQESKSKRVGRRSAYLLSGLVRCRCSKKMYVKRTKLYQCDQCGRKISVIDLEKIFSAFLSDCINNVEFTKFVENFNTLLAKKQALFDEIMNEKALVEKKVQRYVVMRMDDEITRDHFTHNFYLLNKQIAQLDELLQNLRSEMDCDVRQIRLSEEHINEAKALARNWSTIAFEKKRAIIETVTKRILISKKEVHIQLSVNLQNLLHNKGTRHNEVTTLPSSLFERKFSKPIPKNYPENPNTIGEQIKRKRIDSGILQSDLAKIIGVSTGCITNWENNRSKPQISFYPKIHKFLGFITVKLNETSFPGRVKAFRWKRGLTYRQMGGLLGVDGSTVNAWEKGKSFPSRVRIEMFDAIAKKHL